MVFREFSFLQQWFRGMSTALDRRKQWNRMLLRLGDHTELHRCQSLVSESSKSPFRDHQWQTFRRIAIDQWFSFSSQWFLLDWSERNWSKKKCVRISSNSSLIFLFSDIYRWISSTEQFSSMNYFCSGQPAQRYNFYFQEYDQCIGLEIPSNSSACFRDWTCPNVARFLCELCQFDHLRYFIEYFFSLFQIDSTNKKKQWQRLILKLFTTWIEKNTKVELKNEKKSRTTLKE